MEHDCTQLYWLSLLGQLLIKCLTVSLLNNIQYNIKPRAHFYQLFIFLFLKIFLLIAELVFLRWLIKVMLEKKNCSLNIIKDEVLLTVGCPIFPPFYIDSQISVHQKFKNIDQLIFRNTKEIYFNEKFPIL